MLSTWNSISGPKVEHLWLCSCHPYCVRTSDGDGKDRDSQKPVVSRKYITMLDFVPPKASGVLQSSGRWQSPGIAATPNHYLPVYDVEKCLKMSGKLLISEMEGKKPCIETVSKLYIMGNYIICSVVFHKRPWSTEDTEDVSQCSCLSVMLRNEDTDVTFDVQRIIDLHLRKAASLMQRSLVPPSSLIGEVKVIMDELCQVLCSTSKSCEIQRLPTCLFSQFQAQMKFLARAVSSHLQTCGFSVVTGDTKLLVCQLAQILLLFNSEQEKLSSDSHVQVAQTQYFSGLHVQAIPRGRKVVFLPDVVFRDYPLSVIDADWQKVRQTLSEGGGVEYNSNLLRTVSDGGSLITRFLEDLVYLEENGHAVRNAIEVFKKFLHMKAVALVKMCEKYRATGHFPTQRQMINLLNLQDVNDLRTIAGCAEKLQPGISSVFL